MRRFLERQFEIIDRLAVGVLAGLLFAYGHYHDHDATVLEVLAGIVNGSGAHNCTLNTTGPAMLNGANNPVNGPDCIGFYAAVQPLRVQNQGTQNVSLNLTFNATGAQLIGGTTPEFGFRGGNNETNTCGGVNGAYQSVASAATNYTVCGGTMMNWVTGARTLNIDFGMRIPQDAPPGARKIIVTAYASTHKGGTMTDQPTTDQPVQQQAATAPQQPGASDLSKRTLVMLVAFSCIISLLGTIAMVYELSAAHTAPVIGRNNGHASAEVGFAIGAGPAQPKQPSSGATGFATFKIGE